MTRPAPDTVWVVDLTDGSLAASITSDEFVRITVGRDGALPKVLTPDCGEVRVASIAPDVGPTETRVQRVEFDGTVTEIGMYNRPAEFVAPEIDVLADGSVVWFDGLFGPDQRLVRLADGTTFFEGSGCGNQGFDEDLSTVEQLNASRKIAA